MAEGEKSTSDWSSLPSDVSLSKALNPSFAWLNDCCSSPLPGRQAGMA